MQRKQDAAGFVAALRAGRTKPVTLTLTGLAKIEEEAGDGFHLALDAGCTDWTFVPSALVEEVEFVRTVKCKDHEHPLVAVTFAAPATPEGELYLALLAQLRERPAAASERTRPGPNHDGPLGWSIHWPWEDVPTCINKCAEDTSTHQGYLNCIKRHC